MAKVKVFKKTTTHRELDIDYPVYIYYQDEDCCDTIVAVFEDKHIMVSYDLLGVSIKGGGHYSITDSDINNFVSKERFEEFFKEALESITK